MSEGVNTTADTHWTQSKLGKLNLSTIHSVSTPRGTCLSFRLVPVVIMLPSLSEHLEVFMVRWFIWACDTLMMPGSLACYPYSWTTVFGELRRWRKEEEEVEGGVGVGGCNMLAKSLPCSKHGCGTAKAWSSHAFRLWTHLFRRVTFPEWRRSQWLQINKGATYRDLDGRELAATDSSKSHNKENTKHVQ